jgi:hypothetical protein
VGLAIAAGAVGCRPPVPTVAAHVTDRAKPVTTSTTVVPTAAVAPARGGSGGGGGSHKPATTTTTRPAGTTSTTTRPPATTSTTAPPTTSTTAPSATGVLFVSDYSGATVPGDVWQQEEEQAPDRLTLVDTDHGRVLRAEVRPGDVASGGNRTEVWGRHAPSHGTPADQWPDPVGSTRWYGFDLRLADDFATDPTGLVWLSLTQWKGVAGGQPAIALEVKRDRLQLAGASARNDLGPIKRGQWEHIVVGVHFDATDAGWVEVYRDGAQALPRTNRATTTLVNGAPDPTYFKQGIYRSSAWTVPHVALFGPVTIGLARTDVS